MDSYRVVEFNILEPTEQEQLRALRIAHIVQIEAETITNQTGEDDPEESPQKERINLVKTIDQEGNEKVVSFRENSAGVDPDILLGQLEASRFARCGRIHETLRDRLQDMPDNQVVDIIVWAHIKENVTSYDKLNHELSPQLRRIFQARDAIVNRITSQGGTVRHRPPQQPYLHASVLKSKIQGLSESEHVGAVLYDDQSYEIDLSNPHRRSAIQRCVYSRTQSWPVVIPKTQICPDKSSNHARLTHAIIKNIEPDHPHGHAPDCSLYSANSPETAALEWALHQDCTVISQSFHRKTGAQSPDIQPDDILKDWMATKWPFPTIGMAAGSLGDEKYYVNHKSYNTLIVGSHNDSVLAMSGTTEYRNPTSRHHDRELPEIAANGTVVGAIGQLNSGTSFSAPAVAGVVALIQGIDHSLKRYPEGCRAIILASAHRNVVGGTWWGDLCAKIDGKAGAGALDAQVGMDIASRRRSSWAIPTVSGWDVDTLFESNFNKQRIAASQYYVQTPSASQTTASTTAIIVKAVLAWNSKVSSSNTKALTSELTVDLDLVLKDARGDFVAVSTSLDSSYEIVEFYAEPDHIYELDIIWATGKPATWYGIAWTAREVPWARKRP